MTLIEKYKTLDPERQKANIGRYLAYATLFDKESADYFKQQLREFYAMQDDITG